MSGIEFDSNRYGGLKKAAGAMREGRLPGVWGVAQTIVGHWVISKDERGLMAYSRAALNTFGTLYDYRESKREMKSEGQEPMRAWLKKEGYNLAFKGVDGAFASFVRSAISDIPYEKRRVRNMLGQFGEGALMGFSIGKGKTAYFIDDLSKGRGESSNSSSNTFWRGPFCKPDDFNALETFIGKHIWERLDTGTLRLSRQFHFMGADIRLDALSDEFDFLSCDDTWNDVRAMGKRQDAFLKKGRSRCLLFRGAPGTGKCLGGGTLVIMADGRVLPVERVEAGDRLMGPDGTARTVLSTTSGVGALYRVYPVKGDPWVCNDKHVLTLVNTDTDALVDISLDKWLTKNKNFRTRNKQFSVGVARFENELAESPIDPYFLGLWFGDGTKSLRQLADGSCVVAQVEVTKPDQVVRDICESVAAHWGLHVRTDRNNRCPTHNIIAQRGRPNSLLNAIRDLVGANVEIPATILQGDKSIRLQFLAGFLDADAELNCNCFIVNQKRKDWARAIWWVARSLGFCATMGTRTARNQDGYEGTYFVVTISGNTDQIPTRIPRKQAAVRRIRKVATRTGIAVEPIGEGDYYGFALDGDGRFLLGDFTVTHNSTLARAIAREIGRRVLVADHEAMGALDGGTISRIISLLDPGVLVLNDVDRANSEEYRGLLDALEQRRDKVLLTCLTVNDVSRLDPALLRPGRVSQVIRVEEPGEDSRAKLLRYYSDKYKVRFSNVESERMLKETDGFSPSDIRELCEVADAVGIESAFGEIPRLKEQRALYAGDACEDFNRRRSGETLAKGQPMRHR